MLITFLFLIHANLSNAQTIEDLSAAALWADARSTDPRGGHARHQIELAIETLKLDRMVADRLRHRLAPLGTRLSRLSRSERALALNRDAQLLARTIDRLSGESSRAMNSTQLVDAIKIVTHAYVLAGARDRSTVVSAFTRWVGLDRAAREIDRFWLEVQRGLDEAHPISHAAADSRVIAVRVVRTLIDAGSLNVACDRALAQSTP